MMTFDLFLTKKHN